MESRNMVILSVDKRLKTNSWLTRSSQLVIDWSAHVTSTASNVALLLLKTALWLDLCQRLRTERSATSENDSACQINIDESMQKSPSDDLIIVFVLTWRLGLSSAWLLNMGCWSRFIQMWRETTVVNRVSLLGAWWEVWTCPDGTNILYEMELWTSC